MTEEGRRAWLGTFDPQTNEEEKVLAALDPGEREQFDRLLRKMMRAVDHPGLLKTPKSAESGESGESGDEATRHRSRFTTDPGPE